MSTVLIVEELERLTVALTRIARAFEAMGQNSTAASVRAMLTALKRAKGRMRYRRHYDRIARKKA